MRTTRQECAAQARRRLVVAAGARAAKGPSSEGASRPLYAAQADGQLSGTSRSSCPEHFLEIREVLAVMFEVDRQIIERGDLAESAMASRSRKLLRR